MSEHRRKQQSNPGSTPPGRRGPQPQPGPPPRRTAGPQGARPPQGSPSEPRLTRAEMRRGAQAKGRRGAGSGPAGPTGAKPKRFLDYPRWGKTGVRRWLPSFKQILSGALLMFVAVVGLVGYAYASIKVPGITQASQQQNNIFYWSDGSVMATTGTVNRQNVSIQDVPQTVQEDFMAAEDETFLTNSGIDPTSILRAVKNMATGGDIQSGSTITQQWVKNSVLGDTQQTLSRKFQEIVISVKVGRGAYTKQQVLQAYLNSNYYGRGANGIEAAAEAYYHVHAKDLTLSQGAFIAATVNQPSYYQNVASDKAVKAAAVQRWDYVLDRMAKNHWMTPADRAKLTPDKFPMPVPWVRNPTLTGQTGYMVDLATNYLQTHTTPKVTDAELAQGGYQIHTTFVKSKVNALTAAVDKVTKEHIDPKKRPSTDKYFQTGAASVDPKTGAVVAIYGGPGEQTGQDNDNANTSGVPVGSTFKPIDMAAALEKGAVLNSGGPNGPRSPITPDSKFNGNDLITVKNQSGQLLLDKNNQPFKQKNDSTAMPGYITLRTAMANSVNTAYVQLGEDVGYKDVLDMAQKLQLNSGLESDTAGFYIGTSTPNAVRMANVYATFANGGVAHSPYTVSAVDVSGTDVQKPVLAKVVSVQAMSPETAATVSSMLQSVVQYGTATAAQALGRPAAGKTGTTDEYKSAWFIGFTPQLATSVEMFRENLGHGGLLSMIGTGTGQKTTFYGGKLPTEVWTDYMIAALKGTPVVNFPAMPNLSKGANEFGAPTPTPTPTATPTAPPTTAPPTTAPPTATSTPSWPTSPSPTSTCRLGGMFCQPTGPTPTGSGTGTPGVPGAPGAPDPTNTRRGLVSTGGAGVLG